MDSNILGVASAVLEKIDSKTMMQTFIEKSKNSWEKIRECDEEYFKSNALQFFSGLPEKQVSDMSKLLMGKDEKGKYYVSPEVRKTIWAYLGSFVKICLKDLAPEGKGILGKEVYQQYLQNWQLKI